MSCLRFLNFLLWLAGLIPFSLRASLGYLLGYVYGLVPTRDARIAKLQSRRFLSEQFPVSIPKVFASIGQSSAESLNLSPVLRNSDTFIQCDQWPQIEQWTSSKQGIVALTAHTGNWDLLASYMVKRGLELTVIGKEMRHATVQGALSALRERHGVKTLWRADASATKQIVSQLRSGKIVAALIDQDTTVTSRMVPFFGEPAKTPSALISLAQRTQSRIVSAFLARTSFNRYRIFVEEIPPGSEEEVLKTFHLHLENFIRNFPHQWVWFHKRWRTTIEGETLSTQKYIKKLQLSLPS